MKIKTLLGGIIPTLIFNFKAFGIINTLKMKFPVFVGGGVTIGKVSRDTISFGASVVTGMVHIGMGGVSDMPYNIIMAILELMMAHVLSFQGGQQ